MPVVLEDHDMTSIEPGTPVIVRGYQSGVYYGRFERLDGQEATLKDARRIWRWEGALETLSLAALGPVKESRLSDTVTRLIVTDALDIIEMSTKAYKQAEAIPSDRSGTTAYNVVDNAVNQ